MTTKTVKLIVFITLLVHGIGHFQGVAAGLGVKINKKVPAQSWLLKGLSTNANRTICIALFMLTGILGVITALSFNNTLFAHSIWPTMATVTALLSTICLILFPHGFAMFFNKVGAIGVNLVIYYSIVFSQQWPGVIFED